MLPIGLATACSLAAANVAYFYLSLAFIQVLKAFAPVITFGVLIAFGLDRHNPKILVHFFRHMCLGVDRVLRGDAFYSHGLVVHAYRGGERGDEVGRDTVAAGQSEDGVDSRGCIIFVRPLIFLTLFTAIFEGQNLFSREHKSHEYWYLFALARD